MKTAKELVDELAAAGLTQAEIADETDLTQATISRIQSGTSRALSDTWRRLNAFHAKRFPASEQSSAA